MLPAIVLAAGQSLRMGRPKALLPTGTPGETFITQIVGTLEASEVDDIIVVVASNSSDVRVALADRPSVRIVENEQPDRGQLSSILVGLRIVDRPGVRGAMVTLVDLPLVTGDTVRAVIEAARRTGAPIVRPICAGKHGHPVIFARQVFDELRRADLKVGAKEVLQAHADDIINVPVEDQGAIEDIDTAADYQRVFGRKVPSE